MTGTVYYHVRKYLNEVFNPLIINEYTIKDFFDAFTRIKNIPQELFDQGYRCVSFDVVPLLPKCHYKKNQHYIKKILCRKNNKRYYQEKHYEKTYERHL